MRLQFCIENLPAISAWREGLDDARRLQLNTKLGLVRMAAGDQDKRGIVCTVSYARYVQNPENRNSNLMTFGSACHQCWAGTVPIEAVRSTNARNTAGQRTASIAMRVIVPSLSPTRIHRPASLRSRRSPLPATCWIRSATLARIARPREAFKIHHFDRHFALPRLLDWASVPPPKQPCA